LWNGHTENPAKSRHRTLFLKIKLLAGPAGANPDLPEPPNDLTGRYRLITPNNA
jgi:hypothetical protein